MVLPNWLTALSILELLDSAHAFKTYDYDANVTLGNWGFEASEKTAWQDSDEQKNLLKHMGAIGPYVQASGFGIEYSELPESLEVDRVFLLSRHGERYPSTSLSVTLNATYNKLKGMDVKNYTGPLAFVEDWEYFVDDPAEQLDLLVNNTSPYAGVSGLRKFGKKFREKYSALYDENKTIPVFTSGQQRVADSAAAFSEGFMGHNGTDPMLRMVVLPEEEYMGYNTLTTATSCSPFDESTSYAERYIPVIMDEEAKRLNRMSPGFSLNATDVDYLIQYCAYEMNARGYSDVCEALSMNAIIEREYVWDLNMWYADAMQAYAFNLGAVHVNATLALLSDDEAAADSEDKQKMWLNFAHDTDILYMLNAMGAYDWQTEPLSIDKVDYSRFFKTSEIIPMAAHLIIERIKDKKTGEKFLRVLLNDAVLPLKNCQDGPYMTCKLETFMEQFYRKLARHESFKSQCKVSDDYPQYLSFYWDWKDGHYNETAS